MENDELLSSLDNLKLQTKKIEEQIQKQQIIFEQLEIQVQKYHRLSEISAKTFFTLQNLSRIN